MKKKIDPKLRAVAMYASLQVDQAQIRLIDAALDGKPLYDDNYWQGVLDHIRTELLSICAENEKR